MWAHLSDDVKIAILRFLDDKQLRQAMSVDKRTKVLASMVLHARVRALTAYDDPGVFLSPHAVAYALSNAPLLRMFVQLPPFVPENVMVGPVIGSGGTNSVYEVNQQPMLAMKVAGAKKGTSKEYQALVKMGTLGLKTVLRDLRLSGGQLQIVMDRIYGCVDSKTIVGYQHDLVNYMNPNLELPAPNPKYAFQIRQETIAQLLWGWERMCQERTFFSDYQFLIDPEGNVVLNDPTAVAKKDSGTTKSVIQAMIDTWEFLHGFDFGGWRNFKLAKRAEFKRCREILGKTLHNQLNNPDFFLVDYSFCRFEHVPESTMFRSAVSADVPEFTRFTLGGGRFGYALTALLPLKPSSHDLSSWS